jgi:ABC-type multidrug transport system permease subunit
MPVRIPPESVFGFARNHRSFSAGLHKYPETAQISGLLITIPLIFASSVFVLPVTMPGWLQGFANNQPVSVFVNTARALTQGGPVSHWLWLSIVWCAGILLVFVPLAVRLYRKI